MNPITIFTGGQNTGKTATVQRISQKKETVWIDLFNRDSFYQLSENTELIIIDEADFSYGLSLIKWFIENEKIIFRKPYSNEVKVIARPEVIICTNWKKEEIPVGILSKVTLREFFHHSIK